MGSKSKLGFITWMIFMFFYSLVYFAKSCFDIVSLGLHGQYCLETWWLAPPILNLVIGIVSVLGFLGCVCRNECLKTLFKYLIAMAWLIIALYFIYHVFAMGLRPKPPSVLYDNVYTKNSPLKKEYKWMLRTHLVSPSMWRQTRKCFHKLQFCDHIGYNSNDFMAWKIEDHYPTMARGCCRPPARCGLVRDNGGASNHWVVPESGRNFTKNDKDCNTWADVVYDRCLDCDACKAARIERFQDEYYMYAKYMRIVVTFAIVSSLLLYFGALTEEDGDGTQVAMYVRPDQIN